MSSPVAGDHRNPSTASTSGDSVHSSALASPLAGTQPDDIARFLQRHGVQPLDAKAVMMAATAAAGENGGGEKHASSPSSRPASAVAVSSSPTMKGAASASSPGGSVAAAAAAAEIDDADLLPNGAVAGAAASSSPVALSTAARARTGRSGHSEDTEYVPWDDVYDSACTPIDGNPADVWSIDDYADEHDDRVFLYPTYAAGAGIPRNSHMSLLQGAGFDLARIPFTQCRPYLKEPPPSNLPLESFDLRVIYDAGKTGFEDNKEFNITPGTIIAGRYKITEYIGSAAFSRAVQAIDLKHNAYVCVKIVRNSKDFFDQAMDEIKLLHYINCLAKDDMELLTDTGFIGYTEARRRYDAGELLVAGYDQKTRCIVYEKPSHFIDKDGAPADGMYEFKERLVEVPSSDGSDARSYDGNGYSIKVTGNHQILMQVDDQTPWGGSSRRTAETKLCELGPVKATVKQIITGEEPVRAKMSAKTPLERKKWPAGVKSVDANGQTKLGAKPRAELDNGDPLYYMATAVNGLEGASLRDCISVASLVPAWPEPRRARRDDAEEDDAHMAAQEVALCELIGFWLGDGSLQSGAELQSAVVFSQTKDSDVEYIQCRLNLLGLGVGVDYSRCHYPATATQAELTVFRVTRRSWVELFFGEFACKYTGGFAAATALGVGASAEAAWRREFNTAPPTDAQIKLRAMAECDDDIDTETVDADNINNDVNANRPLGTPSMGLKDGGAETNNNNVIMVEEGDAASTSTTTTTTTTTNIKSAKWFWRWVWRLRCAHTLAIIKGLTEADGSSSSSSENNDNEDNCVYTSSVAFRDQLVRLAVHAGRSPKYLRTYTAGTNRGTDKNGIPIVAKHDHWRVTFSIPSSRASPIFSRNDIVKVNNYNAGVWCVTMPQTGNVVVRRKHTDPAMGYTSYRPVVIGNCNGDPDENRVVQLYDFFYFKEHVFLVCELLRDNLYEFGKYNREHEEEAYFNLPRLQSITRQVLQALAYVHSLNLLHCDLKPENVLIKSYSRCEIKLIDFGSSCFTTDNLSSYIQSRCYRAPEVVLGCKYDGRIDIWSLGCMLPELATGHVLFHNDTLAQMLTRIAALLGPFPQRMVREGRHTCRYATRSGLFYELVSPEEQQKQNPATATDEDRLVFYYPKPRKLEELCGFDDPEYLDFVRQALTVDHTLRPTAVQMLKHPFLTKDYGSVGTTASTGSGGSGGGGSSSKASEASPQQQPQQAKAKPAHSPPSAANPASPNAVSAAAAKAEKSAAATSASPK